MSKFHITATKTITIGGTEYKAAIDKHVDIEFSATTYTTKLQEGGHGNREIVLVPDDMNFLHEVTDIFPLTEYDIAVVQAIYNRHKHHICLYLDITEKATQEKLFFSESATLSDEDYAYIYGILIKEYPQFEWQTAEEYLRSEIGQYLGDVPMDLFTDEAMGFLGKMVSAQCEKAKMNGIVEFYCNAAVDIAKEILENALRDAYNSQDALQK